MLTTLVVCTRQPKLATVDDARNSPAERLLCKLYTGAIDKKQTASLA